MKNFFYLIFCLSAINCGPNCREPQNVPFVLQIQEIYNPMVMKILKYHDKNKNFPDLEFFEDEWITWSDKSRVYYPQVVPKYYMRGNDIIGFYTSVGECVYYCKFVTKGQWVCFVKGKFDEDVKIYW